MIQTGEEITPENGDTSTPTFHFQEEFLTFSLFSSQDVLSCETGLFSLLFHRRFPSFFVNSRLQGRTPFPGPFLRFPVGWGDCHEVFLSSVVGPSVSLRLREMGGLLKIKTAQMLSGGI